MRSEEGSYTVSSMCRRLGVSKSGYYSWRWCKDSKTASRRKELAELVRAEFEASNGVYGYRRITASLARKGVGVDPDTVHRIMGSLGPGRRNRNERSAPLPLGVKGWKQRGGVRRLLVG
ncbi:IS3 family transposase [Actinomyces bowdenii]